MASRKLTDSVIARIQARKRDGLTLKQLAEEFKVSVGSVANALSTKLPEASQPTEPKEEPRSIETGEPGSEPAEPLEMGVEEIRTMLAAMGRTLRDLGEEARKKGDKGVYLQFVKATTAAMKELGRFTPPKPPDPEDDPDMVEAAKTARAKIIEAVRRRATTGKP